MSEQDWLDEIQARAEACEAYYMSPLGEIVIKQDVPRLIAEIRRLRAALDTIAHKGPPYESYTMRLIAADALSGASAQGPEE